MKTPFRITSAFRRIAVLLVPFFLVGFLTAPLTAQSTKTAASSKTGKTKTAAQSSEGAKKGKSKKASSDSASSAAARAARKARAARSGGKSAKSSSALSALETDIAAATAEDAATAAASGPSTAADEALAAAGEEPEGITPELAAEIELAKKKGTVPEFSGEEGSGFNIDEEDAFYNESIQSRRDDDAVPVTSLLLRRYADFIVQKYDFNKDGKLSESEWSKMGGSPQSIDMNGDFILDSPEIVYYLARYARERTIFNPIPPTPADRRHMVVTDGAVLLRPLSGPLKTETPEEAEKAEGEEELADLTEEDLDALLDETEETVGTVDDPKLFGLLQEEMDESKQREFAAPLEQLKGMPVWFLSRDTNGDGQLSLREFAPGLSLEATAFFGKLDLDHDGLLTPDEVREYMKNNNAGL